MSNRYARAWLMVLCTALLGAGSPAVAVAFDDDNEAIGFERTPPRLAFTDGEVSFLRPGAEEWSPARVNTALAAGDELYTAKSANLELQIGARAFVRAGESTQLGLTNLEPDFLQFHVTSGHVSLDLRSLKKGQTLEIDTPNSAFTIERTGYYRVEVEDETTTFASRRGGRATLTPASGDPVAIAPSEQVVVTGGDAPQVESYAAPELDAWDRWNYARTDDQIDAVSARYLPSDVYGADDLDQYGDWRVVPTYGAVWVPRGVAVGWAPYSTGRWLYDPYYGWTWVDEAPWGWAPYHYGRWVRVSSYWGWCPGPIVVRPYYAPALVAFYGGGGFSLSFGTPYIGWVALGWGEPIVPWWGPARFRAYPRWGGWGGPRVVNKVVVKNTTVIKVKDINVYENVHVRDAFVTVDRKHFGRRDDGNAHYGHYGRGKPDKFRPVYDEHPVRPDRSSVVVERGPARRPPQEAWKRSVVATREPRQDAAPALEPRRGGSSRRDSREEAPEAKPEAPEATPPARVVAPPREGNRIETSKRPPFGQRGQDERRIPPPAPRFEPSARPDGDDHAKGEREENSRRGPSTRRKQAPAAPDRHEQAPAAPDRHDAGDGSWQREERSQPRPSERQASRTEAPPSRVEHAQPERDLPGEPANRVYRQPEPRAEAGPGESDHGTRAHEGGDSRADRQHPGGGGDSGGGQPWQEPRGRGGRD